VLYFSAPGWQLASACVRTGSLICHLDLVYVPPAPAHGPNTGAAAATGDAAAKRVAAADAAANAVLSPFTAVSAAYTASPFVAAATTAKPASAASAVNSGGTGDSSSSRDVLDGGSIGRRRGAGGLTSTWACLTPGPGVVCDVPEVVWCFGLQIPSLTEYEHL
jgi:hypothetical protein